MRRDLEIAWAAGFFDGEGTTGCIARKHDGRALYVAVGQKNTENLARFQRAIGFGNITGPNAAGMSVWRAYGERAHDAIRILWPHLGAEKQDQALRALLRYIFRPVGNRVSPGQCRRGHPLAGGAYTDPRGRRECAVCRAERRAGPLPRNRPIAIEKRIGVREYQPAVEA